MLTGGRVVRGMLQVFLALAVLACNPQPSPQAYQPVYSASPPQGGGVREYVLGVHPLHNPGQLFKVYAPLVDLLNVRLPEARFMLEASRNYEEYDKKLGSRHFDLALPNPYQTSVALKRGYRVFGKMGDDDQFRGIILVRADSDIHEVSDLAGKPVSFPARTALAATMLPQAFLHDHGLPVSSYKQLYVGSQESSIMNVILGATVAGATWPPPWQAFQREHPEQAGQLKVLWTTESLPNNSLMARDDFPPELLQRLAAVLFSLEESAEGRQILERMQLSRFEAATAETYLPVERFLEVFRIKVRTLDEDGK